MNNSTLLQEELISAFTQGFVYAWGFAAMTVILTDSHAGNSQTGWESPPLVCFSSYISQAISQSLLIHILPVLYVYDFILTLPLEVSEIWSSKFSGATLAYLLNRYGTLWFFCHQCACVPCTYFRCVRKYTIFLIQIYLSDQLFLIDVNSNYIHIYAGKSETVK